MHPTNSKHADDVYKIRSGQPATRQAPECVIYGEKSVSQTQNTHREVVGYFL